MKIDFNGILRDMTPDEEAEYRKAMAEMPEPEPTAEERLCDLETKLAALTEGYAEGVNQA